MAGLESIALAVDFLEQQAQKDAKTSDENTLTTTEAADSRGEAPSPTAAPMPSRSGFLNAPRRVSSDTISSEDQQQPPSSCSDSPLPELAAVESMSPEEIAKVVENLADDGEFQEPPPPPPDPSEVIFRVMDADVLCGRGGETNHHYGNVQYRALVKRYQPLYIMSKRRDKPLIASKIVRLIRHKGGRFLRKDKRNTWRDVGNTKAREKTSQALREGAPDLRAPQSKGSNKEERAASPPQAVSTPSSSSPLQSSLGVRKHTDGQAGPYNSGMGLYHHPAGASIVETHPGEVDRSFHGPSNKKMRLPAAMPPLGGHPPPPPMHHQSLPPQYWGGPQHAFMHGVPAPPAHYMNVASPTTTTTGSANMTTATRASPPPVVSPQAFAAAVSADDDDSKSSEDHSQQQQQGEAPARPKPRGPRLKLLKKRSQEEQLGSC